MFYPSVEDCYTELERCLALERGKAPEDRDAYWVEFLEEKEAFGGYSFGDLFGRQLFFENVNRYYHPELEVHKDKGNHPEPDPNDDLPF